MTKDDAWNRYRTETDTLYSPDARNAFFNGWNDSRAEAIANLAAWFDNRRIFRSEAESLAMARRIISGEKDAVSE